MEDGDVKAVAQAAGEIGKAVQETAKLGGKAIDLTTAAGGWLGQTLGGIPGDLLGLLGGDWFHHQRRRNLATMEANTNAHLKRIGAASVAEPSISVVVPLLQAAIDEARPELQDLWAALLTSALMPDGGKRVRRAFFETLKALEPDDAQLFRAMLLAPPTGRPTHEDGQRTGEMNDAVGLKGSAAAVSWRALETLGLVRPGSFGGYFPTEYGKEFWKACNPENSATSDRV